MNYFRNLPNDICRKWKKTLDWIFDEEKFSRCQLKFFTYRLKKLIDYPKNQYKHDSIKNLIFPEKKSNRITMIFSSTEGVGKSFVKHIRNGFAHGNVKCFTYNGQRMLEIKDFYTKAHQQTAYFVIPEEWVFELQNLAEHAKKNEK